MLALELPVLLFFVPLVQPQFSSDFYTFMTTFFENSPYNDTVYIFALFMFNYLDNS